MEKNELQDRLAAGRLTRRQFARAAAAAGVGMMMVPVLARRGAAETGQIEYYTWAGYEEPNLHKGFAAKYGHEPNHSIFGDEEEALQKMLSGYRPDLTHPCTYSVPRWFDAGIIKPVDASRLQHYGDIFPELKTIKGTVTKDGKPLFVPFDWGNSSVLYRTDLVDSNTDSWGLLFDEKYKGRLATYDSVDGAVSSAALLLGFKNISTLDDGQLAKVKELLIKQKPLLRYYWTDQTAVEQSLASGELVAAYAWNASVVVLKKQGVPVEYMNPKEGILTWVCGLALVQGGSGDEQAAYDFIDAATDPQSGEFLIDSYGYGHSNRKSFDLVKPERLAELGLKDPVALFKQGVFLEETPPALKEKYIAMFEAVKAGL
ncbi:MAG TPA: extracellular solute-binding protein [Hypericibacter adhaerens]|jgi:spermidine/putrescine-binding protein|uniref:Spermidine/putrescine ABC transporter n=1 Tax=Hypericibacter adhaerens TaxID=2602016 RepID=A0A5J6MYN0_9PROT|nr:extracellular solute-binding protein [Hypericibacter adhaerens]QEX21390.1 spermidine/putrescine ABC transporter [Hypericibacter adhaerens]HWA44706.1 extracellular solute-binding protein [Hypericibacter adhaerens]